MAQASLSRNSGLELERTQSGIAVPWFLIYDVTWIRVVLIYLFRDDRTANLALTTDVTGSNLPGSYPFD
jgi:hypothetical protein